MVGVDSGGDIVVGECSVVEEKWGCVVCGSTADCCGLGRH